MNPHCGLNTDNPQFQQRAGISGAKPVNPTFVTPMNRRTKGWIHDRVVLKIVLATQSLKLPPLAEPLLGEDVERQLITDGSIVIV